jgi:hypothetical protein
MESSIQQLRLEWRGNNHRANALLTTAIRCRCCRRMRNKSGRDALKNSAAAEPGTNHEQQRTERSRAWAQITGRLPHTRPSWIHGNMLTPLQRNLPTTHSIGSSTTATRKRVGEARNEPEMGSRSPEEDILAQRPRPRSARTDAAQPAKKGKSSTRRRPPPPRLNPIPGQNRSEPTSDAQMHLQSFEEANRSQSAKQSSQTPPPQHVGPMIAMVEMLTGARNPGSLELLEDIY